MKKLILLLIFGSLFIGCATEAQDCAGVGGGSRVLDNCGVCDNDSTNDNTTCPFGTYISTFHAGYSSEDCSGDPHPDWIIDLDVYRHYFTFYADSIGTWSMTENSIITAEGEMTWWHNTLEPISISVSAYNVNEIYVTYTLITTDNYNTLVLYQFNFNVACNKWIFTKELP